MYRFEIMFSRFVDYALLYVLGVWISFISPIYIDPVFYLVFALLLPLLWAPLEVWCIHRLGTTPGCWLFGIHYKTKIHHYKRLKQALWTEKREEVIKVKGGPKRFMKGMIASALIILIGIFSPILFQIFTGGAVGPTISGWVHYHAPIASFGVDFPTEPYQTTKELVVPIVRDPIPYQEFRSFQKDDHSVTYAVSFLQLPLRVRLYGDNTVLKAVLGYLPENGPTARVLSQSLTPFHKYAALNFTLRNDEEAVTGRLLIANGKLFKLTVNYPEGTDVSDLKTQEFLDSFHMRYLLKK